MSLDALRQILSGLPPQVYFFAFGFLLIGWFVVRRLRADERRSKEVKAWCEAIGFRFEKGPDPGSSSEAVRD